MAADNEVRLLSKAVRDRSITPIVEAGVQADWFVNPDARALFRWMMDHWSRYGEVATAATVKAEFPAFPLLAVEDRLEYLLDRFVAYRRYVKVEDAIQSAAEVLSSSNDHEQALQVLDARISEIHREGVPGVTDVHLERDPLRRLREYEEREGGSGMLGIPTGFERIDEATAGLQGGQLVTVIASPKTGKSTLTLQMSINMHRAGRSVLYQSFEMSNHEQQVRHDALRAGVSYNRMRRRILRADEKDRYRAMLQEMEDGPGFVLADSLIGITVAALAAKIDQVRPEIVVVDGVYLMMDASGESNTPQALTAISRGLKRVAQRFDVPVVITTQTLLWKMKGGKVSADSIGYSSSFFQDSDVILGLDRVEGDDEIRELRVVESRHCGPETSVLTWRWETGCFHDESAAVGCLGCAAASRWSPFVPMV